jgi:hypothetical protein
MNNINLMFRMLGPELEPDQEEGFARVAEWEICGRHNGYLMVTALGNPAAIDACFAALHYLGRDPAVIGAWNCDGTQVDGYTFDFAVWQSAAADVDGVRPTEFHDTLGWAGWAPKEI